MLGESRGGKGLTKDDWYARLDSEEGETDLLGWWDRDRDVKNMQQVQVIKDRDGNVQIGARSGKVGRVF